MKTFIRQLVNETVKFTSEHENRHETFSEQISLSVAVTDKTSVPRESMLDQYKLAEKVLTEYLERSQ